MIANETAPLPPGKPGGYPRRHLVILIASFSFLYLDKFGPHIIIDWDEYTSGRYEGLCFSDPDFVIDGCQDQPWTLEGELYKYGNQHYLAIAHTITTLRELGATDDEIFDFFVEQGEEWFGDATGDALMERCMKHAGGGKKSYFYMPHAEDFED